jgi:DNA-binding NtrC family response regulator
MAQGFVIAPAEDQDDREYALTVNDLAAFSLDTILDSLERCRLTGRLTVRWTDETISEAVRQQVIEDATANIPSSGVIYFRDGLIIDAVLGAEGSCDASPREALSIIVRLALAVASGVAASLERLDTIDRPTTINVLNNAGVILDILRVQDEEAAGLEAEVAEFAPSPLPALDREVSQQDPGRSADLLDPQSVIAICSAKSPSELCASVRQATTAERVEICLNGNSVAASGPFCTEAPFELQSSVFRMRVFRPSGDVGQPLNAILQVASSRLLAMPPASETIRSRGDSDDFIAESDEMMQVLWRVRHIAAGDGLQKELAHILITGESGVGKECIAEMIHRCSARKGPWNTRNMSLYSREQAVPEIFGAVKGAYTDLKTDRVGLIEATKGGTILLDEIGEMDPIAQAQLLRVMQTGRYTRLGEQKERTADVRFILATNRDISDSETFRFDLRSRCIEVFVPPLRDRKKDIRPLALHFAHELQLNLTESAIVTMEDQLWPGNVRQLRNLLLQASYLLDPTGLVSSDLLVTLLAEQTRSASGSTQRIPEDAVPALLPGESFEDAQNRFVAAIINVALKDARGNRTHAATRLKLSVVGFKKKARRVGLLRLDGDVEDPDPDESAAVQ